MTAETFEQYGIYGDAPESTYRLLHQHEFDENETTEQLAYPHAFLVSDAFEGLLTQVSVCAGYVYVLLALVGILLNSYVIARLVQLAYSEYERFRGGCGLPLAAMSVSDLSSLCSIVSLVAFSSFVPPDVIGPSVYSAHCKLALYMIHTMTGFSTWCWLFISARRYIAVYHPFWQISKADIGYGSLLAMLAVMLSLNSWLLISVVGQDHTCEAQPLSDTFNWNRLLHATELCFSYVLPAVVTLVLDVRVLIIQPPSFARVAMLEKIRSRTYLFRTHSRRPHFTIRSVQDLLNGLRKALRKPSHFTKADNTSEKAFETPLSDIGSSVDHISINIEHAEPRDRSVSYKITSPTPRRGRTAVRRWLAITTIHLLLNAPDNILRILTITDYSETEDMQPESPLRHLIALVARLLYFAQFCFNAAYLSAIVYRRNIRPQRKTTGQRTCSTLGDLSRSQSRLSRMDTVDARSRSVTLSRRFSMSLSHLDHQDKKPNLLHPQAMLRKSDSRLSFRSETIDYGSLPQQASARSTV